MLSICFWGFNQNFPNDDQQSIRGKKTGMQHHVIENNLGKNESIVRKADISVVALVPMILLAVVLLMLLQVIGLVLAVLLIVAQVFELKSTMLMLTNRRLLGKMGIVGTKDIDVPLNKINTISVEKRLMGQIFGYAHVIVGTSSGQYDVKHVKDADTFRNTVMEEIDRLEEYMMQQQAQQFAQINHMYGGYAAQPNGGQVCGGQLYGGQVNGGQFYGGQANGGQAYGGQLYSGQPYDGQQSFDWGDGWENGSFPYLARIRSALRKERGSAWYGCISKTYSGNRAFAVAAISR